MNNKIINLYNKLNIITFKRYINNEHLIATLKDMSQNRKFNIEGKSNTNINDALDKIEIKTIYKQDPYIYDDIVENLKESELLLGNIKNKLKLAKEKSLDITLDVDNINKDVKNVKILNLNNKKDFYKDNNSNLELNKQDNLGLEANNENIQNTIFNVKKGIFDFDWFHTFIDFMKSNSSLILTISSGLIIGSMWYVNSRGIDVGAMLGRLGLNIYSNLSGSSVSHSNISNTNLELPLSATTTHNHQVAVTAHGFFKQLGSKILEILEIYIEKMKDKRQKY